MADRAPSQRLLQLSRSTSRFQSHRGDLIEVPRMVTMTMTGVTMMIRDEGAAELHLTSTLRGGGDDGRERKRNTV